MPDKGPLDLSTHTAAIAIALGLFVFLLAVAIGTACFQVTHEMSADLFKAGMGMLTGITLALSLKQGGPKPPASV